MNFRCVSFSFDDKHYGLHLDDVVHIIRFEQVLPVPGTSELVEGVLNLRGDVVPVINLRRVLGLKEGGSRRRQRVIIIRREGRMIGLLVDSVREIKVNEADYQPQGKHPGLSGAAALAVLGIVKWQQQTLTILDIFELLANLAQGSAPVQGQSRAVAR
jgi:purine-binding chemotaxis protein CheW